MADQTVARRYATAIFGLAKDANATREVGEDLQRMADAILQNDETRRFFLAPIIERKEKERVLNETFGGKAHDVALHTLLLLVRKRREGLLEEIVRQYDALGMEARGAEPLTITSARELSSEQVHSMVARLEKFYGKKFDVTQEVQIGLIGGARIMMGDRLVDGSVSGRLDELSRTLFAQN
ncbi:MAG: ATP synthase F1 subunit delta [Candidatus Meridianibacter frigidus]|nr:MAG: ATP synthase F1 subunit delta [Candidatus Eremiobacteraeota bacterium]